MFDGQVVRPPQEFRDVAENYVCVRIININEVDLNIFPFDFDLTMAVLLANPDGTVYHRYGGRTSRSPMNMISLVEIMRKGLATHEDYEKDPAPPRRQPPQKLPQLVNGQLAGLMRPVSGCFHCHYAREAHQLMTLEAGDWTPDQFWIFPQPKRVGIKVDQIQQYRVTQVATGSAADAAGIQPGDELQTLDGKRILTKYDIQWILDRSERGAIELPFSLLRDGATIRGNLALATGWKVGDPADYSWRVENPFTSHMIKFLPTPGFIGELLDPDELGTLGLAPDAFALRVMNLSYGPHQAGIRLGDVILSAGGESDFENARDFYAWCESMRLAGRDMKLRVRREGNEMGMMVSLSYLNYTRVERAPQVDIGFVLQQLPGDAGVRVGTVTDDSNAEKAGISIGDRLLSINGAPVSSRELVLSLIDQKVPGDLLMLQVTRQGEPLEFGYILSGEGGPESDVARLSEKVTRAGQELNCVVSIKLPEGKHIYSAHKPGLGMPTKVELRGTGFRLLGALIEPKPERLADPAGGEMWVLAGDVELKQRIQITDPATFRLLLQVDAQICDEERCYEFLATVENRSSEQTFSEFRGDFERQPVLLSTQP